ncbi:MAG: hypothetical protein RJA09_2574 [Pseudomonadota bacterium]
MNVQRFLAATSREAMAQAREAIGDSAVILSSRTTEHGFEVLATAEENLSTLASGTTTAAPTVQRPSVRLQDRADRQLPASRLSRDSTVAEDTETMAMSTLSFQDYVRERMLRKRREALQGAAPVAAPLLSDAPRPRKDTVSPDANIQLPFARAAAAKPVVAPAPLAPQPSKAAPTTKGEAQQVAQMASELAGLKAMIEERFNTLAWLGNTRQSPIQTNLMLKLIRAGYSPTVTRAVMEHLPAELPAADAFRWTQEVLTRNLKTATDASLMCDEGGVFALVGPTGVGKTTAAAKLAAQCVKAYGANSVGLITLDTYRIAAYEQLRTYGRMLGVVAHLAHDRAALQDLLNLLANKRMVIIDTAGMGQKDPRMQEMLELLASPKIKKLLVLNAGSHGDTLDDVLTAYKDADLYGAVLSKLDEAAKLGPAVDALIRHQLVLKGVSTGQRVPEDWQRPEARALVRMSMASAGKSAYDPQSSELGLFFAPGAQPGPFKLEA